jgi:cell division protein FtsL
MNAPMRRQWVRARVADPTETVLRKRTLTFVIVDVVLALALVWMNLMVQDLGYRIEYTGSLIDRLDHEHSELIAEHAQLTSPERLRRLAEDRLGLVPPRAGQVRAVHAEP